MSLSQDIQKIAAGLQKLVDWVDFQSGASEKAETMAFREFYALLDAKGAELGVSLEKVREVQDHPVIAEMDLELGVALDNKGLGAEEHHLDLPLAFEHMAEYRPMLNAENAWVEKNGGFVSDEDLPALQEIVRQYAPKREN